MIKISASMMSADYCNLAEQVRLLEKARVDMLHFDIMDGVFVPNFAMSQLEIKALRALTRLTFDVHLMIKEPTRYIKLFADAGADIISVHAEACKDIRETINEINKYRKKVSIALNPNTPLDALKPFLDKLDMVILMMVNPGFGGQMYIGYVLPKIRELREIIQAKRLDIDIEVDGNVNKDTASVMAKNGANVFVSGTGIFKDGNIEKNVKGMRERAHGK